MKSLQEMSKTELLALAKENSIDVNAKAKKAEIISIIENTLNIKEDVQMEENMNVNEVVNEEKVVFHLDNGEECSRSAYIRQEFQKDRSRQDIAKELGVKYYIVYSATANMFNAAHPENGGAGVAGKGSVLVPKVNADFKYVNAEGVEVATEEEAVTIPRAELMRELANAGKTRSEIKDYFQVPYATVYAATKDLFEGTGNTRERKTVIHPVTGEEVKRADYIRELYDDGNGLDRREIAKQLTALTGDLVDYATVWAATKPKKEAKEEVATDEVPADVEVQE